MSEWSLINVNENFTNYQHVSISPHLERSSLYMSKIKDLKVLEFGCGNGRFIKNLENHCSFEYTGLDCNENFLKIAKEYNFFLVDFNIYENFEDILKNHKNFVFFFDSTLNMSSDPIRLLEFISKYTNKIIIERCHIGKNTINKKYKWDGFKNESDNWHIKIEDILKSCNGFKLEKWDKYGKYSIENFIVLSR
jgi:SAM-dependent methyltransferase